MLISGHSHENISSVAPHFNQKKTFLIFRGNGTFLYFRKMKPPKKILIFEETRTTPKTLMFQESEFLLKKVSYKEAKFI